VKHFAHDVGELAFHRGFAVVSGGAVGCDTAATGGALHAAKAVAGAGVALEILPYGLSHAAIGESCQLSLSPPGEPFTTPAAMERNTLVYAISERSLVVQAQLKQGGSWIGATSALRRHLSSVFIRDDNSSASRALASLGATPIQSPEQLFSLRPSVAQPSIPMLEGTGAA
jgi:predicted Rossmann fold nucleotide-binding protein DprA/Smf involved in DNA uptake